MKKSILCMAVIFVITATALCAGCIGEEEKQYGIGERIYEDLVDTPKETDNQTIVEKEYRYIYNNKEWVIEVKVPQYRLDNYFNEEYNLFESQRGFVKDAYVREVVKQFEAQNEGDKQELAKAMIYFVQSQIEYESDEVVYGIVDYTAYPMECLINGKGDCECKAVLLNCLLVTAGFDAKTISHPVDDVYHRSVIVSDIYPYTDTDNVHGWYRGYEEDVSIIHNNTKYYLISSVGLTPGVGWYSTSWVLQMKTRYVIQTEDSWYTYENGVLSGWGNKVKSEQHFYY